MNNLKSKLEINNLNEQEINELIKNFLLKNQTEATKKSILLMSTIYTLFIIIIMLLVKYTEIQKITYITLIIITSITILIIGQTVVKILDNRTYIKSKLWNIKDCISYINQYNDIPLIEKSSCNKYIVGKQENKMNLSKNKNIYIYYAITVVNENNIYTILNNFKQNKTTIIKKLSIKIPIKEYEQIIRLHTKNKKECENYLRSKNYII